MAFHNVLLSEKLSYGSTGGPGFRTNVIPLNSGLIQTVARQPQTARKWNMSFGVKRHSLIAALRSFYLARGGVANSFRIKDLYDCVTSGDGLDPSLGGTAIGFEDQILGTADGSTQVFQMKRRYDSGSEFYTQNLYLIEDGTSRVGVDGIEQLSGWSVNLVTGEVTFTSAPTSGDVTAGCGYHHKAFFEKEVDELFEAAMSTYGSGDIQIPLVEDLSDQSFVREHNYGGSVAKSDVLASFTCSLAEGRVYSLTNVAGGLTAFMPKTTNLPGGGLYFVFCHRDATGNAIDIAGHPTESQGLFYTLSPDEKIHIFLDRTNQEWFAA